MKSTIKFFALVFVMSFYFTGCYTIVWDPYQEFPDNESSYESSSDFYDYDYYGGYVDYYQTPWWVAYPVYVTYPGGTSTSNSVTKDRTNGNNRNSETETIRNNNGRGNTDRNSGTTNPITPPTTTTNPGSGNTSDVIAPPPPTRNTDSGNTSTNTSSSSTSNTRNSGSSETRNNSGNRNSGSGRR